MLPALAGNRGAHAARRPIALRGCELWGGRSPSGGLVPPHARSRQSRGGREAAKVGEDANCLEGGRSW
eukprot:15705703-Heterocapsa_arctica.AAC.1